MPFTSVEKAVDFIYESLIRAAKYIKHVHGDANRRHPELSRKILEDLGLIPQPYPAVVVTGSKGKGSVSSMLSSILYHSGLTVGLFSGPDLVNYRERIRVNGEMISEEDFLLSINECEPAIRKVMDNLPDNFYISPLGIVLTTALHHFQRRRVNVAVLECGRGGLYDDTRNVPHEYAVISPVMTEHLKELGPTLRDIAVHKAGVITPGVSHVISAAQEREVLSVLKSQAQAVGSRLHILQKDFTVEDITTTATGTRARIKTAKRDYGLVEISVLGEFQAHNAAMAVAAAELMLGELDPAAVKRALSRLSIPGRCQVISHNPFVLVDGTIHRKSAGKVGELVKRYAPHPVVGIIGIPKDKDYRGVIREASSFLDELIITRAANPYLTFPEDAVEVAEHFFAGVRSAPTIKEAVELAETSVGKTGSIIILGTQSLVADALRLYGIDTGRIFL